MLPIHLAKAVMRSHNKQFSAAFSKYWLSLIGYSTLKSFSFILSQNWIETLHAPVTADQGRPNFYLAFTKSLFALELKQISEDGFNWQKHNWIWKGGTSTNADLHKNGHPASDSGNLYADILTMQHLDNVQFVSKHTMDTWLWTKSCHNLNSRLVHSVWG